MNILRLAKTINGYKDNKDGTAAIEFALIAIPFLLILFGVMESGRMMWNMNGVRFAVEETSRYASLNSNLPDTALYTYAKEKLQDMSIDSNALQLTSTMFTASGLDFVEVQATYEHTTMLNGFLPNDYGILDLRASARKAVIN